MPRTQHHCSSAYALEGEAATLSRHKGRFLLKTILKRGDTRPGETLENFVFSKEMVRPERFELPTFWFVARRSIQLS